MTLVVMRVNQEIHKMDHRRQDSKVRGGIKIFIGIKSIQTLRSFVDQDYDKWVLYKLK